MTKEVVDIASYQDSSISYLKTLRQYADSLIVKLTEGSENGSGYLNPKAGMQVGNGLQVFPAVGVYHYFKGNSQLYGDQDPVNEAKWFLKNIVALGLDRNTVVVIDVEDSSLMKNVTHDINLFLAYLADKGYSKQLVYASASWFNEGRINQAELYQQSPIWVAAYNDNAPGVDAASAWQYTNNGHGLHVDFSYDFEGRLSGTSGSIKQSDERWPATTSQYEVIAASVLVYQDAKLTQPTGEKLAAGSIVTATPVSDGLMVGRSYYLAANHTQIKVRGEK
ncbi:GH25 family lysozyme [Secundilactobacillus kimchicus]|uniref:Glycoside hydrolase family 25 n=1 Tax=Secundilactobacillus kimchicus JCM 15530 TaxID=1302272 RepID=A0A0R1HME9_9LACO|nr:GH25 family lysozyme [Secundilactobacillus kimchicus]KRK47583.1 glycoside hydrolase family 25 [Secundilactobacillus kimchicus JCM 15530]MBT9672233.1 autolysin [Secundilactobacillus kimchicus]